MHTPTAVPASFEGYDRSIASLVAAFICDAFIRWMFPDSRQYLHYFPLVLKYFAGRAFEHSSAYRSTDFKAAAMCIPLYQRFGCETCGEIQAGSSPVITAMFRAARWPSAA